MLTQFLTPPAFPAVQDSQAHRIDNMRIMQAGEDLACCGAGNLADLNSDFPMRSFHVGNIFSPKNIPNGAPISIPRVFLGGSQLSNQMMNVEFDGELGSAYPPMSEHSCGKPHHECKSFSEQETMGFPTSFCMFQPGIPT